METINKNSKKAQAYINAYNRSEIDSLNRAYANPSTASEGGHGYKIIGHGAHFLTVAWIEGNALRVETACNSFVIPNAAE